MQAITEIDIDDSEIDRIITSTNKLITVDKKSINKAIDLINASKKPIMVAGVGSVASKISNELLLFMHKIDSPACVTLQAVGNLPCNDTLYLGMYGWFGTPIDEMLKEADLIITVGLDGWDIIRPYKSEVPIISIDDADVNDRTFQPVSVGLKGNMAETLRSLQNLLEERETDSDWLEKAKDCFEKIHNFELGISSEYKESSGIAPQAVYKEIRKVVPEETIIAADAGAHKSLASQAWLTNLPLKYFVSNGLSPMGFSLGAAMGAKLALPSAPVISFVGDGGFLMYAGELATWRRLNIAMIQVIMVDNGLTQVKSKQLKKGYNTESTSFEKIEYKKIVESFGIDAIEADNVSELVQGIKMALQLNKPVSIIVNLDGSEYLRMPSAV